MSQLLHVCLYNTDSESSRELCAAIQSLSHVRLVAEIDDPDALTDLLASGGTNLIFFHLDPDGSVVVPVIEGVYARHPEVAMVALSHHAEPSAILPRCAPAASSSCASPSIRTILWRP